MQVELIFLKRTDILGGSINYQCSGEEEETVTLGHLDTTLEYANFVNSYYWYLYAIAFITVSMY